MGQWELNLLQLSSSFLMLTGNITVFESESQKGPESKHLRFIPVHFHVSQLEAWFSTRLSLKLGN